jgi:hypothetical protein
VFESLLPTKDPEEWRKILDRFFQILTEGGRRFELPTNR